MIDNTPSTTSLPMQQGDKTVPSVAGLDRVAIELINKMYIEVLKSKKEFEEFKKEFKLMIKKSKKRRRKLKEERKKIEEEEKQTSRTMGGTTSLSNGHVVPMYSDYGSRHFNPQRDAWGQGLSNRTDCRGKVIGKAHPYNRG